MNRRAVPLLLVPLALAAAGCGGAEEDAGPGAVAATTGTTTTAAATTAATTSAATAPATDLRIEVWPTGRKGPSTTLRLTCDPAGGDVPDARAACAALGARDEPFAAPREDMACTEIYGGPEEAHVKGTYRGAPVDARFDRTNGCAIDLWSDVVGALTGEGIAGG